MVSRAVSQWVEAVAPMAFRTSVATVVVTVTYGIGFGLGGLGLSLAYSACDAACATSWWGSGIPLVDRQPRLAEETNMRGGQP